LVECVDRVDKLMLRLGLLINPYAGIGGSMALKGSDHVDIPRLIAQGGQCLAEKRVATLLCGLRPYQADIQWLAAPSIMGAAVLTKSEFSVQVVGSLNTAVSSAEDTERLAVALVDAGVDLLLFVGGDGTARNIVNGLRAAGYEQQLVLGIPAGVKMHSGVYTVSPQAAIPIVASLVHGEPVSTAIQEVRDIDEEALRQGQLNSRYYGELRVPNDSRYVQQVKNTALPNEQASQLEIAAGIVDEMDNDTLYLIGCGTTPKAIMDELNLPNSLLGIDVLLGRTLIATDVTAIELEALLSQYPYHSVVLLITAIGGQGHIIGRGNQQLSSAVLARVGKHNTRVLIAPTKLAEFEQRPLLIDSGDPVLDQQWSGLITLYTGYQQTVVYPLSNGWYQHD
jgi:predicted polyphosphate/ATP-dependent NAD kinase